MIIYFHLLVHMLNSLQYIELTKVIDKFSVFQTIVALMKQNNQKKFICYSLFIECYQLYCFTHFVFSPITICFGINPYYFFFSFLSNSLYKMCTINIRKWKKKTKQKWKNYGAASFSFFFLIFVFFFRINIYEII